jgi:hypothetical protein
MIDASSISMKNAAATVKAMTREFRSRIVKPTPVCNFALDPVLRSGFDDGRWGREFPLVFREHGGYPGETVVLLKYRRVSWGNRRGGTHYTALAKGGGSRERTPANVDTLFRVKYFVDGCG